MIDNPSTGNASSTRWFKSSYSDSSSGNNCVEVAAGREEVLVRDSKNTQGPVLTFEERAWADFTSFTARG
ncbi:DUF397 domain-containing protein [Streptomyces drozdowiczii]